MRPFHPHGRAVEPVVITHERPVVVQILAGEIERRAVVSPRDRHCLLDDVARLVKLAGVIEPRSAPRKQRTPGAPADAVPRVVARAARRGVGFHAEAALAVPGLQRDEMVDVVERGGGAQREMRCAGVAGLGRDHDDALPRAGAVDRPRSRTLQDLYRLDVVGVQVHRPVRHHRAFARVAAVVRIEVRSRLGRVVNRHAIHNDERLVVAHDRANATDLDERRRTGITRLRADEHVRGLRRQSFDDILLVALDDLVRGNVVPHAPEFLGRAGRARARHHDFTELQRVRGEIEILLHDSRLERHLNSRRLVPKAACDDGDGLPRLRTSAGDHDRVAAIIPRVCSQPERGNDDFRVPDRRAHRHDPTAQGDRLLRRRPVRRRSTHSNR